MFLLHLQDLKTWGCYGWIVTLQEFLEMKVDEVIDPLNAILLNFDNKVRRSWYIFIWFEWTKLSSMGLLEAPCWIANEGNFALPSKFMDLEISLFDQEYPPTTKDLELGGGISWWEERLLSIKTRPAVSRISIKVYKSPDQSRLKYHGSIRISFRAKSSSLLTRPRWSSTKLSLQAFKSDCQH